MAVILYLKYIIPATVSLVRWRYLSSFWKISLCGGIRSQDQTEAPEKQWHSMQLVPLYPVAFTIVSV